jgi:pyruvate dehydrogenase E2 component (dihydrolipoamide acetyltransferase)
MPTEFKIPELGENVSAGDVVRVLIKAGDTVAKDQPVLELETDKATIEVPSSVAGTVDDIKVKPGDKVSVGQTVFTLADGAGAKERPEEKGAEPGRAEDKPAKDAPAKDAPAKGGGKAAAGRGQKGGGQGARPKPQPAGAAEDGGMSQAAVPRRDEPAHEPREEGDEEDDERPAAVAEEAPRQKPRGEVVDISRGARSTAAAPAEAPQGPPPPAAPSVRRLARELGVDIRRVSGSGPDGRISLEDVQAFVRSALSGGGAAGTAGRAAAPLPDFTRWGPVERKPLSNIRRKTAEHLGHAWDVVAHVTQHDRADITAMEALRTRFALQAERAGGKLTMTAIALKIVAGALQRFPHFNSSIDLASNEIIYKSAVHIGVAADTPRGLLVPVVRDADRKGILELSRDLTQLSDKARAGKLALDEMQGGGFTITNLGGIGGTSFTPIVNWPEVAILGVSRASFEPVWRPGSVEGEGTFEPRLMLPLSLSYDHRVIDGADAARFLRWVCDAFEQPFVLAL